MDAVLETEFLARRLTRPVNPTAENLALGVLAETMANSPAALLQTLVRVITDFSPAESAVVSVLEPGGPDGMFRWAATAGRLAPFTNWTMPRPETPCGVVVDRDASLLFRYPERRFSGLRGLDSPICEMVVVPFRAESRVLGTVWAVSHSNKVRFDAEDLRFLTTVAPFASVAHHLANRMRRPPRVAFPREAANETVVEQAPRSRSDPPIPARPTERTPVPPLAPAAEGVCVVQISRSDRTRRAECRFVLVSPAFEHRTGLKHALGRTARQLLGAQGNAWVAILDRVVQKGERTCVDTAILGLGGDSELCAFPYGAAEDGYVALQFIDESDRRHALDRRREEQERYWTLLDSIDQGFCVIEVLFDVDQRAVDCRFRDVNTVFEKQTGIYDVAGKLMSELPKARALGWTETLGRVAMTGEPVRFEGQLYEPTQRHFDIYVFRLQGESRFVAVLCHDITARKLLEQATRLATERLEQQVHARTQELREANTALQREISDRVMAERARTDLLRRLSSAQEDERRRIARDLHDQTGQLLAGLALAINAISKVPGLPTTAARRIDDARRITGELSRQVHLLAVRMRPTALDDLGLPAALRHLASEWAASTGLEVDLEVTGMEKNRLPAEVETTLYRVVQESLTNVAKHAQAARVSIVVSRNNEHAYAVVEDDGRGFSVSAAPSGRLGLVGMRERVSLAGGTLEVESAEGHGTSIVARVPLHEADGELQ